MQNDVNLHASYQIIIQGLVSTKCGLHQAGSESSGGVPTKKPTSSAKQPTKVPIGVKQPSKSSAKQPTQAPTSVKQPSTPTSVKQPTKTQERAKDPKTSPASSNDIPVHVVVILSLQLLFWFTCF